MNINDLMNEKMEDIERYQKTKVKNGKTKSIEQKRSEALSRHKSNKKYYEGKKAKTQKQSANQLKNAKYNIIVDKYDTFEYRQNGYIYTYRDIFTNQQIKVLERLRVEKQINGLIEMHEGILSKDSRPLKTIRDCTKVVETLVITQNIVIDTWDF
jgi:hypothetical protein